MNEPSLSEKIRAIPCDHRIIDPDSMGWWAYDEGHHDARHAAAELAQTRESELLKVRDAAQALIDFIKHKHASRTPDVPFAFTCPYMRDLEAALATQKDAVQG